MHLWKQRWSAPMGKPGKSIKSIALHPGVFHLLEDNQLLPGCCRYQAATSWWHQSDRCHGPGQAMCKWALLSAQSLWSPARHRSHSKDNVQFPHSKRATNGNTENYCTKYWAAHTVGSCHWDCLRLLFKVSSYLKFSVCGVRNPTLNSSTLCYFPLIFPQFIHHNHNQPTVIQTAFVTTSFIHSPYLYWRSILKLSSILMCRQCQNPVH